MLCYFANGQRYPPVFSRRLEVTSTSISADIRQQKSISIKPRLINFGPIALAYFVFFFLFTIIYILERPSSAINVYDAVSMCSGNFSSTSSEYLQYLFTFYGPVVGRRMKKKTIRRNKKAMKNIYILQYLIKFTLKII